MQPLRIELEVDEVALHHLLQLPHRRGQQGVVLLARARAPVFVVDVDVGVEARPPAAGGRVHDLVQVVAAKFCRAVTVAVTDLVKFLLKKIPHQPHSKTGLLKRCSVTDTDLEALRDYHIFPSWKVEGPARHAHLV